MITNMIATKPEYLDHDEVAHFELGPSSQLRGVLCAGAGPDCRSNPSQNLVVLSETLLCTQGTDECEIESPRIVKVAEDRYWEYVRPPCVVQSVFNDAREIRPHNRNTPGAVCANADLQVAFEACCENGAVVCPKGFTMDTWYGTYATVSDLQGDERFPDQPVESEVVDSGTSLDILRRGDRFGSRIRTYISPDVTGEYTFWLKGDDAGELYISSSAASTDLQKIAYFVSAVSVVVPSGAHFVLCLTILLREHFNDLLSTDHLEVFVRQHCVSEV